MGQGMPVATGGKVPGPDELRSCRMIAPRAAAGMSGGGMDSQYDPVDPTGAASGREARRRGTRRNGSGSHTKGTASCFRLLTDCGLLRNHDEFRFSIDLVGGSLPNRAGHGKLIGT